MALYSVTKSNFKCNANILLEKKKTLHYLSIIDSGAIMKVVIMLWDIRSISPSLEVYYCGK